MPTSSPIKKEAKIMKKPELNAIKTTRDTTQSKFPSANDGPRISNLSGMGMDEPPKSVKQKKVIDTGDRIGVRQTTQLKNDETRKIKFSGERSFDVTNVFKINYEH